MKEYSLENYIDTICAEESFKDSVAKAAKVTAQKIKEAIKWLIEKWKQFLDMVKKAFMKFFSKRIPDVAVECEQDAIDALVEAGVMIKADNVDSLSAIPDAPKTFVPNTSATGTVVGDTNSKPSMEAIGYTDLQAYNTIVSLRNINDVFNSVKDDNDVVNKETGLVKTSFLLKIIKGMLYPIDKRNKVIKEIQGHEDMIDTPFLQRIRNSFLVFMEVCALVIRITKSIIVKAITTPRIQPNVNVERFKNANIKRRRYV